MPRQTKFAAFLMAGSTCHNHAMWRHPQTENRFSTRRSGKRWRERSRPRDLVDYFSPMFSVSTTKPLWR